MLNQNLENLIQKEANTLPQYMHASSCAHAVRADKNCDCMIWATLRKVAAITLNELTEGPARVNPLLTVKDIDRAMNELKNRKLEVYMSDWVEPK